MQSTKLKVYWTVINGERFSAALSEEEARKLIREDAKELQTKPSEWSVEAVTESVAVVEARLTDTATAGMGCREITWDCPHTGERIETEVFADEEPPVLMFTNADGQLALVSW